jgi:hypothetical protein
MTDTVGKVILCGAGYGDAIDLRFRPVKRPMAINC